MRDRCEHALHTVEAAMIGEGIIEVRQEHQAGTRTGWDTIQVAG